MNGLTSKTNLSNSSYHVTLAQF